MPASVAAPVSAALAGVPAIFHAEAAAIAAQVLTQSAASRECTFAIDGLVIRCRFLDDILFEKIAPAFAHLALSGVPNAQADLNIQLWAEHPGTSLIPAPHPLMMETSQKHLLRLCSDDRHRAFDEDWLGTRTWIDLDAGNAFYAVRDADALPYYESAAPLRALLNAFLNHHGRQLVHASAVGNQAGGLLLVGEGGSGKSSTALLCLDSPLFHLADDWCVIAPGETPRLASLYNSAKLRPGNLARFPYIATRIHNHDKLDEEKATLFLHDHFPQKLLRGCPARAIILPTVTGQPTTRLERIGGTATWRAMVACTLAQIPGADRRSIALMSAFAARLPAYRLHLGTDLPAIPQVLADLLTELTP